MIDAVHIAHMFTASSSSSSLGLLSLSSPLASRGDSLFPSVSFLSMEHLMVCSSGLGRGAAHQDTKKNLGACRSVR